jgi:acyl-CoA synthetase (AMP-forming)/AMP-acid ligase II
MMRTPLLISRILDHGSTVHGRASVATWLGGGARRTSFAEVGASARRLANVLRGLGITGDQRVATLMWNNVEHLIAYLAVPSMGAVLHPLNIRLFPEQLVYIVNHAEDEVVIVDATLTPLLAALLPSTPTVRHVIVVGDADTTALAAGGVTVHSWDALLAGVEDQFSWPELDENDAASLCYTSGTTGNPKGVAYSHRSIWLHSVHICSAEGFLVGPSERALVIVPMFHAAAWGVPMAAFMSGASLVLPDRFLHAASLAEVIATERPTNASAVPTIWADLLAYLDANPTDISSLREVVIGGSSCPPALMRAFESRHGVQVIHAWGMTETSPLGTVARAPSDATGEEFWAYRYSQGRFPAGVQARVSDPAGTLLPSDGKTVGEIVVRGAWVSGSYLGDAEGDPERFRDGWLRTGDVGTITEDGFLNLTDRAKDMIKSGGEWISSVDLENSIMSHPAVLEACVVGVPDERWGERPLATVVLREGQTVTAAELTEFLAGKVARWQLPDHWTFVDAVPKTSVGKFDKKRVRADYASQR